MKYTDCGLWTFGAILFWLMFMDGTTAEYSCKTHPSIINHEDTTYYFCQDNITSYMDAVELCASLKGRLPFFSDTTKEPLRTIIINSLQNNQNGWISWVQDPADEEDSCSFYEYGKISHTEHLRHTGCTGIASGFHAICIYGETGETTSPTHDTDGQTIGTEVIIGIVVGIVLAIAVIIAIVVVCVLYRRKRDGKTLPTIFPRIIPRNKKRNQDTSQQQNYENVQVEKSKPRIAAYATSNQGGGRIAEYASTNHGGGQIGAYATSNQGGENTYYASIDEQSPPTKPPRTYQAVQPKKMDFKSELMRKLRSRKSDGDNEVSNKGKTVDEYATVNKPPRGMLNK